VHGRHVRLPLPKGDLMFIFSRTTNLDRHDLMAGIAASVEVAGMVTEITGVTVNVFLSRFGEASNSVRWSCRTESHVELQSMMDTLMAHAGYQAWVDDHNALFETSPVDHLARVVSSSGTDAAPSKYYTTLTATAQNGKMAAAVEFGMKAQAWVAATTGLATAFLAPVYGPFGTVTWLTGAASMDDVDRLEQMQAGDPGYHALVAEAADLFVVGSGSSGLIEKLN
jgi:hypothetical protein